MTRVPIWLMQQNTTKGEGTGKRKRGKRKKIMLELETVLDKAFRHQITWKNMENNIQMADRKNKIRQELFEIINSNTLRLLRGQHELLRGVVKA